MEFKPKKNGEKGLSKMHCQKKFPSKDEIVKFIQKNEKEFFIEDWKCVRNLVVNSYTYTFKKRL